MAAERARLGHGSFRGVFTPASESVLPSLVADHELAQANAVAGLGEQISFIVGPVLGGVLVATVGVWAVFALDAASFVVAACTVLAAPTAAAPQRGTPTVAELLHQIGEGVANAQQSHEVQVVLLVISAATLSYSGVFAVALPALAASFGSATSLGVMVSGWGAGQFLGVLAASFTGLPRRWGLLIIGMSLVEAVMFATLGVVPGPWVAAALLFVVGIGVSYSSDVALPTFIQAHTPRHLLGRISAVMGLPRVVFEPVSIAVIGLALSHSTTWGFALAAVPVLAAGTFLALDPRARQLSAHRTDAGDAG